MNFEVFPVIGEKQKERTVLLRFGVRISRIGKFDIRSGQGAHTITRSMSGGYQQKAIVAREIDRDPDVLNAVQPTRGLDVGASEYIHGKLVEEREMCIRDRI